MNTTKPKRIAGQIEDSPPPLVPAAEYPIAPADGTQFGEYEETCIGTDLTLEWDSTDPELHQHMLQPEQNSAEDTGWNVKEAGIPDA